MKARLVVPEDNIVVVVPDAPTAEENESVKVLGMYCHWPGLGKFQSSVTCGKVIPCPSTWSQNRLATGQLNSRCPQVSAAVLHNSQMSFSKMCFLKRLLLV
jgi:hypothetical protein